MFSTWIDTAAQIQRDAATSQTQLLSRDRAVGQTLLAKRPFESVMGEGKSVEGAGGGSGGGGASRASWMRLSTPVKAALLAGWLDAVWPKDEAKASEQVMGALWFVGLLGAGLGLFLGLAVVSAVFFYDGSQPVNVTRVLWVLVGLPLVLFVLSVLLVMTANGGSRGRGRGGGGGSGGGVFGKVTRLPPIQALSQVLGALQVGGLWRVLRRIMPLEMRHALDRVWHQPDLLAGAGREGEGAGQLADPVVGEGQLSAIGVTGQMTLKRQPVWQWQVLRWTQAFAVAYQVGVLGGFAVLISVEDRAFAWSTTLASTQEAEETYAQLVQTIAMPWSFLGEPWVPSQDLVNKTGYDRFAIQHAASGTYESQSSKSIEMDLSESIDQFDSQASKAWWRFLAMAIVVYGLLPRLVLWCVCVYKMRQTACAALVRMPGVDDVFRRLTQPVIVTHGTAVQGDSSESNISQQDESKLAGELDPASDLTSSVGTPQDSATSYQSASAEPVALIVWGEAPWMTPGLGGGSAKPSQDHVIVDGDGVTYESMLQMDAGGRCTLAEDDMAIEKTVEMAREQRVSRVLVAVRSWEPPTGELTDCLKQLRGQLDQAQCDGLSVLLWPLNEQGQLVSDAQTVMRWQRYLKQLGDPWLKLTWQR